MNVNESLATRHARMLERHAFEVVVEAAREQEMLAADGASPFTLDWVAIRDSIPASKPRSRFRLRSAGIQSLESEVFRLVREGYSSSHAIHVRLADMFGDAVELKQVTRALHKLTTRDALVRTGRNTYRAGRP